MVFTHLMFDMKGWRTMPTVIETTVHPDIQKIVEEIVRHFQPLKIILFGSHACGTANVDSDVDLMIVMNTEEPTIHIAARIAASIPHLLPVDVVVKTPNELQMAIQQGNVFETEVLQRGIVLYEDKNNRVD